MAAVVSDDHADPSLCAEALAASSAGRPRPISAEEVKRHGTKTDFWAVVDGYVVDATEFCKSHPGGLRKLLSTDDAATGATGAAFGFSFSRGRNAHFPGTGARFRDGVKRYLAHREDRGIRDEPYLPPADVAFPPYGKITILGRFAPGGRR